MFRLTPFLITTILLHFVTATFFNQFERSNTVDVINSENDFYDANLSPDDLTHSIGRSLYVSEAVGKSHRFYFVAGERIDGKKMPVNFILNN